MQGTVKWFSEKKGFGFIHGEDGRDYFCHWRGIMDKFDHDGRRLFATLAENAKVEFLLEEKDGRQTAVSVKEIQEKGIEKGHENRAKTEEIAGERIM